MVYDLYKGSHSIYHCDACGLTIDRNFDAAINIKRTVMERPKESMYVGRGTPEFTPVETGSIPERANPAVETTSPLR
jgi:transposase